MNGDPVAEVHDPEDLSDIRCCLLLLDRMPEWRGRLRDMAGLSPVWNRLTLHWGEIEARFVSECGPDLDHRPASNTHRFVRAVIEDALHPS